MKMLKRNSREHFFLSAKMNAQHSSLFIPHIWWLNEVEILLNLRNSFLGVDQRSNGSSIAV